MRRKERRLVLVHRRTRLQELIARHNTLEQARFTVERLGGDFDDYLTEDTTYQKALDRAEASLQCWGLVQKLERDFLPNYLFGPKDVVVVVGQDGLVANTLKYLNGQPVIAVNPDPARYEGVLLPFEPRNFIAVVRETLAGNFRTEQVTLAEARLNDGQRLLAVNDFFIGPRRHTTAAYALTSGERTEFQMSSGVIVATGLGSTGWLRSLLLGAGRLAETVGVECAPESLLREQRWGSRSLLYAVREPYPGKACGTEAVFGRIDAAAPFAVTSAMAEEGVIFSDGMLDDAMSFNAGARVEIGAAEQVGQLVV